jgi:hypothetical protein
MPARSVDRLSKAPRVKASQQSFAFAAKLFSQSRAEAGNRRPRKPPKGAFG